MAPWTGEGSAYPVTEAAVRAGQTALFLESAKDISVFEKELLAVLWPQDVNVMKKKKKDILQVGKRQF